VLLGYDIVLSFRRFSQVKKTDVLLTDLNVTYTRGETLAV
jgi:hypothetical protein